MGTNATIAFANEAVVVVDSALGRELADAIRRDMRRELELAQTDRQWADWHAYNAHKDLQLLELVNPKHTHTQPQPPIAVAEVIPIPTLPELAVAA